MSRARVRGEREYGKTLSGSREVVEPLSYFSYSRTVQVRQSVLNMAAIANFRQGRARAEYSTEVFRGKQNDLALRLSSAYFQALLSQHAIDLAQAKVQSIEQQLKTAEVQFQAGDGTVTDVDEARARRDLAQAQLIEARNQLTVAMRSLQELVGDKPVSLAQLKADFAKQLKPELETLDTWLDRALETSADIAASAGRWKWPNAKWTKPPAICPRWMSMPALVALSRTVFQHQPGIPHPPVGRAGEYPDFLWRLHQRGHHASHRQPRARAQRAGSHGEQNPY